MKVATWNVNGIRAREGDVLAWVEREAPDVLCLQEVKASPEQVPPSLCELDGYWCYWHGHKGYSGVGLHLKKSAFPARPAFEHPGFDHENRIVVARVGEWAFASIYVPNGGKDFPAKIRFLQSLEDWVITEGGRGTQLILCGDLNVAKEERDVHPTLRKADQIGQTPQERALLSGLIGRGLVDLQRVFEPANDALYTWWAPWRNLREKNVGWRLDYVLPSQALAARATSCASFREFGTSDHAPVLAQFDVQPPKVEVATPIAEKPAVPAQPKAPAEAPSSSPQLAFSFDDEPKR